MLKIIKLILLLFPSVLIGQQLGFALEQIRGEALLKENLTGKGVKVGIIDGGFLKADEKMSLAHLFEGNLIAGYKDFLDSLDMPFSGSKALDDGHGTQVWTNIAGYNARKKLRYGAATHATFYLARTDHGKYERREEELNAIRAMKWMAKEGVRIINLSLGYNYGYTDTLENYTPNQMDGKTTLITRAVNEITSQYDVLIIVAAGNDGDKDWKIIDAPADAENVLTVGATKLKSWDDMPYSSKGPGWLDYAKPEVACFSSDGTSFSTPVITGLAACLLEKDPTLSSKKLKDIIIKSAHLSFPNNYIGHGVPNAERALALLEYESSDRDIQKVSTHKNFFKYELVGKGIPYIVAYHKKGWEVLKKEKIRTKRKVVKIKRPIGASHTTIIWNDQSLEISWE